MAEQKTISIGIDLGTTNSAVAINIEGKIQIIKKIGGVAYTPSVFGFDRAGNKVVGEKAYEALFKNASEDGVSNYKAEIKRLMGTSEKFKFERAGVEMGPEEISAEILKNLKESILKKYSNFNTVAAVITVPAAFTVLQSEATKRAGNLAGFKHVVLLQEPIAAAVSYGFSNTKDENWLVYDLGGGTFDVALISCKKGIVSVLGHSGDNFLGGKNIDQEIVDKILVPKILEKYSLEDFNRNNKKFNTIFNKLKYVAEMAKIQLSEYENISILIEEVGTDDKGKDIFIQIEFTRKDFEKLIKPLVDQTIVLAKQTLKEAGVKNSLVAKVLLVGGPTQIPYIRERIEKDLKIKVDATNDPLTVVAQGACIFGLSQKIPKELLEIVDEKEIKDKMSIDLNYESLTADTEVTVSGIIEELRGSNDEFYIQIQSDSGFYSGSKIKIKNGTFYDDVVVEEGKTNTYWIYLFDKNGDTVKLDNDSFVITHGLSVAGAPIPHSVNVVIAQKDPLQNVVVNICKRIFEKGAMLPLKFISDEKGYEFKTSKKLKKGVDDKLDIVLVEGESETPDRNSYLCDAVIEGNSLPYDLPEGTPITLTVDINESRTVSLAVYIPLIDLTAVQARTVKDQELDVKKIDYDLRIQEEKARTVLHNVTSKEERDRINNLIYSINTSLNNAQVDEDAKRKANKQLKDLKILLDEAEKEREMPQLIGEFNEIIQSTQKIINEYADDKDREENNKQLNNLQTEGQNAISSNDKNLLIRINEQLHELKGKALFSNPTTWIYHFEKITEPGQKFTDDNQANYYKDKGRRAIESGDVEELKRCTRQLINLMPFEQQNVIKSSLSGITL